MTWLEPALITDVHGAQSYTSIMYPFGSFWDRAVGRVSLLSTAGPVLFWKGGEHGWVGTD